LVSTNTLNDIAAMQQKRLAEGLSTRTVNCEVATLRRILKHYGCWVALAGQWSYSRAFETAKLKSGVECRFYDARHTFVTRLAENRAVSVETIRQLAGHVSEKTLARYAHIRVQARRDAIATLERETEPQSPFQILRTGHKIGHSRVQNTADC
jgi:Phage integrase family